MAKGIHSNHRMSFPRIAETDVERARELRTNELFRDRFQPEHHKEFSILEQLPIDMISGFPTSDSLHLLDLGVIKRYFYS